MTNPNQDMNKGNAADDAAKFNAEIKKAYPKLSDDDVKLYSGSRDQFFAKLKEKQDVSKEDGEKKLQEIKASCGSACSSEKTDAAKAA